MFKVGDIFGYIEETGRITLEVIARNGNTITVIDNNGRERILTVTYNRNEERAEVWQYGKVHGYIYADRDLAQQWTCGVNSGVDYNDRWYAVRKDQGDTYENGSYRYKEALDMLKEQGCGFISVISGDSGDVIEEIEYKDLF